MIAALYVVQNCIWSTLTPSTEAPASLEDSARPTGNPMPRARHLGIPLDGTPGAWNAITDVAGVEVGHVTLIEGDSIRTGVTAIFPRSRQYDPVFAATSALNGNG